MLVFPADKLWPFQNWSAGKKIVILFVILQLSEKRNINCTWNKKDRMKVINLFLRLNLQVLKPGPNADRHMLLFHWIAAEKNPQNLFNTVIIKPQTPASPMWCGQSNEQYSKQCHLGPVLLYLTQIHLEILVCTHFILSIKTSSSWICSCILVLLLVFLLRFNGIFSVWPFI